MSELPSQILLGRQPILNDKLEIYGYELLFRNSVENSAQIDFEDQATARVIVNSFMEIGIDKLVGNKMAFINFPRNLLLSEDIRILPSKQTVIEILENIEPEHQVLAAIHALAERGFTIAMDDFEYAKKFDPLLRLSSIVKVDIMALGLTRAIEQIEKLAPFKVKMLAEKVESHEEYVQCKAAGFNYFQGYFFSKPEIVASNKLPQNRLLLMQLISRLYDPDITFPQLEELISQNVSLSFRLLKITNSAANGISRKIDSIKQAVSYIGLAKIRNWTSFLLFSGVEDKPQELFKNSLIRAQMCKLLATRIGLKDLDACFTIGLFSTLDALMNQPLSSLIEPLPLSAETKAAILEHKGTPGEILSCVIACERCDWDKIALHSVNSGDIKIAFVEAIAWAGQLIQQIYEK